MTKPDRTWEDDLMAVLDRHEPNWEVHWAHEVDLRDKIMSPQFNLRERVAGRLFHRIIHAALEAGIVNEPIFD